MSHARSAPPTDILTITPTLPCALPAAPMPDTDSTAVMPPPPVGAALRAPRGMRRLLDARARTTVTARVVLQFAVPGLLVLLLVGLGAVMVFRHRSETEAIRDARQLTRAIGLGMVEPRLTEGIVRGDPAAVAALDRYVRAKVLPTEPALVRLKLWTGDGHLVYSDE